MKAYRGRGGIVPLIHKLGKYVDEDTWSSSGTRPLNLGKNPDNERLGGSQGRSERFREEKALLPVL